jgi:hypothetical protein
MSETRTIEIEIDNYDGEGWEVSDSLLGNLDSFSVDVGMSLEEYADWLDSLSRQIQNRASMSRAEANGEDGW